MLFLIYEAIIANW